MNKDLRTVVEHKLAEHPQEAKEKKTRVDLGALAPEGLPKDVTPEEIAALAAAAAQVKGKIAESLRQNLAEPKAEHKTEVEEQAQSQAPQPTPEVVSQAATFAEQKSEENRRKGREQDRSIGGEVGRRGPGTGQHPHAKFERCDGCNYPAGIGCGRVRQFGERVLVTQFGEPHCG